MSNRYTDTEKWEDPWYRNLKPYQKCFWEFLLCKCNHAGIWKPDFAAATFFVGQNLIEKDCISFLDGRITVLSSGRWYINKYVCFQQKINSLDELNPNNKCHLSIIKILEKEGLLSPCLGASEPLARGYSIGKGNGKGKKEGVVGGDQLFETVWSEYPDKTGKSLAKTAFAATVKTDQDAADIVHALANYKRHLSVNTWKRPQNGKTWFRYWQDWIKYTPEMEPKTEKDKNDELSRSLYRSDVTVPGKKSYASA